MLVGSLRGSIDTRVAPKLLRGSQPARLCPPKLSLKKFCHHPSRKWFQRSFRLQNRSVLAAGTALWPLQEVCRHPSVSKVAAGWQLARLCSHPKMFPKQLRDRNRRLAQSPRGLAALSPPRGSKGRQPSRASRVAAEWQPTQLCSHPSVSQETVGRCPK